MANVAAISQLMETAVPATQAAPSSSAPDHRFATAMRQANSDAGVPVEEQAQATQSSPTGAAGKSEEGEPQVAGQLMQPSSAAATNVLPAAIPKSTPRYTPANMLSGMLAHTAGAVLNTATAAKSATAMRTALSTAASPLQSIAAAAALPVLSSAPAPANVNVAALPGGDTPSKTVAFDDAPVDLSVPVPVQSVVSSVVGKPTVKEESTTASVPVRPATKQDAASKVAELASTASLPQTPVTLQDFSSPPAAEAANTGALTGALTGATIDATTRASTGASIHTAPVMPTVVPAASPTPIVAATAAAAVNGNIPAVQPTSGTAQFASAVSPTIQAALASLPDQSTSFTGQTSGATFKQSLSTTPPANLAISEAHTATSSVAAEHTLPVLANKESVTASNSQHVPATAIPQVAPAAATPLGSAALSLATGPMVQPDATPAPAAATLPNAVPVSVPSPAVQSAGAQKASSKPGSFVSAPQAAAPESQAAVQSTIQAAVQSTAASPGPTTDGKAAFHAPVPVVIAPAPVAAVDGAAPMAAAFPVAHTPVAVTTLSNPTGPALATTPLSSTASTFTPPDSLQHTTLSSTPTTLEVGVAGGTHGWLKIRAELNASGTVDASLTGANAAAIGKLHNDLPALSSFLQDERVAVGLLNVAAPGATASALHATVAATLEPTSSFTRSAAEGVGATGTAVASDAGASGGRAPQQQAPESSPGIVVAREDDGVSRAIAVPVPALYGDTNEFGGSDGLSPGGYGGGGWLNVRA